MSIEMIHRNGDALDIKVETRCTRLQLNKLNNKRSLNNLNKLLNNKLESQSEVRTRLTRDNNIDHLIEMVA